MYYNACRLKSMYARVKNFKQLKKLKIEQVSMN